MVQWCILHGLEGNADCSLQAWVSSPMLSHD